MASPSACQRPLGIALAEALDDWRQDVSRLGVRGGYAQAAAASVAELAGDAGDVLGFGEQAGGEFQDALAGGGDLGEVLSLAAENLEAQFVLQQADLLADAGLGGMKRGSRRGDVESTPHHLVDVAQLPDFHVGERGYEAGDGSQRLAPEVT